MSTQHFMASMTIMASLLGAAVSSGHEMTDRYVPVGHYPELRSPYTSIGEIASLDGQTVTLTGEDAATHAYQITEDTKIWLDRSLLKLENLVGDIGDIKTGMRAEIKGRGPERPDEALWIKLQVAP